MTMTKLIPENEDNRSAAQVKADGYIKTTNLIFREQLEKVYSDVQDFWYANRDEDGNPSLKGDEPTGIEIMQAMGPRAQAVYAAAARRAEMVINIANDLGQPKVIDYSRLIAPYELEFEGGALTKWTQR